MYLFFPFEINVAGWKGTLGIFAIEFSQIAAYDFLEIVRIEEDRSSRNKEKS